MPYLHILRSPFVTRLLLGSWVGRLPPAMAALAIPLALRDAGASYDFVGAAAGAFAIASAVGSPLLGRLVDRIGQTSVLAATAVLSGAGFAAIALAPGRHAIVLAGAVLAGAATPPIEPCLRALWPDLVPARNLESAYALDSSAQELIFVTGPLVVAACIAVASPTSVLWAEALLGVVGVLVVATAAPSRRWRAEARSTHWLGPLRSPGLAILLAGMIGMGFAIGTLNILAVHYAENRHIWGGSPTLLALNSAGALIGALVYGAMKWTLPAPRRALAFAAGLVVGYTLLILLPAPPYMVPLMLATGMFLAPLLTVAFTLVGELAPPGTTTEAFAWLVTLFATGTSLGSAATGAVLQGADEHWAASCGALGVATTLLIVLAGQRKLAAAPVAQPHRPPVADAA
ncbi:MFS transporter [Streptomyces sulfonofaciens]|uniref:MFS transporter n=1 Tax=Streptomyces sulfonofaciens TaxID=68272 RepID=A0A919L8U6_9ACTN|nr:MFS transporter [Streptomyces sulfonofaciens]GHH88243.1 MFS transporter [Streptomyces sulfonofaciens]